MSQSPPLIRNRAKERLEAGEMVLCLGTRLARTVDIGMVADACGFDAFYVDMEHSAAALETAAAMCAAALTVGITPLVRTPGHQPHTASRLLDTGALGIIYPHVNTKREAEAFVSACKFPPVGHRSVGGSGPAQLYRALPLADVNRQGNAVTLCIAMLETPEGIENADAIASVEGLDVLLIGSNDLSAELGVPGDLRHPKIRAAYEAAANACKRHGKHLGIGGVRGDPDLTRELVGLGGRFMITGFDIGYLMAAARADAAQIRKIAATR
ncbi:MAG TPA: aldolase/citrate lyase family protein [Xanthobacteraceae bacterium]|nr:aldolase/citrate lyase family protein [Xanthobacteraceae bacterium]